MRKQTESLCVSGILQIKASERAYRKVPPAPHNVPQSGTYRARRSCIYRLKSIAGKQINLSGHPEWAYKPGAAGTGALHIEWAKAHISSEAKPRISTKTHRRINQSFLPLHTSGRAFMAAMPPGRVARCRRHRSLAYRVGDISSEAKPRIST